MNPQNITLERFQAIVLKLGNQMFVRHYLWLNYPEDPQLMGLQFTTQREPGRQRPHTRSCECGECKTCKHRDYQRNSRPIQSDGLYRLFDELKELGFVRREDGIWTIARTQLASEAK